MKTFHNLILIICAVLMLSGCLTRNIKYATSVPPEQLCTLKIHPALYIDQFDGDAVDWSAGLFSNDASVQIPKGRHDFLISYYTRGGGYSHSAKDIRYSHTFEAGKTYVMWPAESNGQVFIYIRPE